MREQALFGDSVFRFNAELNLRVVEAKNRINDGVVAKRQFYMTKELYLKSRAI